MKNKKGFTLVELMAVIVVLAIIIAIAVPSYFKISEKIKADNYKNKIEYIKNAAIKYAEDTNVYAVYVEELIKSGYIEADDELGIIYDVRDNTSLNCYVVLVREEKGILYAEISKEYKDDKNTCDIETLNSLKSVVYIDIHDNVTNKKITNKTSYWSKNDVKLEIKFTDNTNEKYKNNVKKITWRYGNNEVTHDINGDFNNSEYNNLLVNTSDNTFMNQEYKVELIIAQDNEEITLATSAYVRIDKVKPKFYTGNSVTPNNNTWSKEKKVASNAYDYESGLLGYQIIDSNEICSLTSSLYKNEYSFTLNKSGKKKICIMDNVGNINEKEIEVINIDDIPPTITFTPNGNATYVRTISTKVDVIDNESGIKNDSLKYIITTKNDGIKDAEIINPFTNNSSVELKSLTGTYYVWAIAKDNADNTVIKTSSSFKLDNTAPTCTISGVPTGAVQSTTLTVNGTDNHSGVASYSWDGVNYSSTKTKYVTANGTYTAYVKDNAGNTKSCSATITQIDNTAPTCEWSGENTTWTKNDITITSTCKDSGSGCVTSNYTKSYSGVTKKTEELSWTIKDKAGNSTTCSKTVNVYIDNKAPKCGSVDNGSNVSNWRTSAQEVGVLCSDDHSGCSKELFTKSFSNAETGTITIKDNVGNTKDCTVNVYVDTKKPTIKCSFKTNGLSVSTCSGRNLAYYLSCSYTDNLSGLGDRSAAWGGSDDYSVNGGEPNIVSGTLSGLSGSDTLCQRSNFGTYEIVIKDRAGNRASKKANY